MTEMLLPDINVWLALVFDAHVHHPSALAWLNSLSDEQLSSAASLSTASCGWPTTQRFFRPTQSRPIRHGTYTIRPSAILASRSPLNPPD